jgi:hypothetical protein
MLQKLGMEQVGQTVGSLNTARRGVGGAGTDNTAALAFGGTDAGNPTLAVTESWNGSAWTEVNDLNQARERLGGTGTETSGL